MQSTIRRATCLPFHCSRWDSSRRQHRSTARISSNIAVATRLLVGQNILAVLCVLVLISATLPAQAESSNTSSLLETVLDFLGISASPSALKGRGEDLDRGDVWVAHLDSRVRIRRTWDGGYRCPVFVPGDAGIVALKGERLLRIPPWGGEPERLWSIPGVKKIVGFHRRDPDKALTLLETDKGISVGVLSLKSGELRLVPYQKGDKTRRMLAHLEGWNRVYGGTKVYVETESRLGTQWTDVYVQRENEPPVNVSWCDGANCGQPSLSPDGKRLVYVKAEE